MADLPATALSVRQPWAWAILHAGKDIENRSAGAIRAGRMVPGRIALHAASGMREVEYAWAVVRLAEHGVTCPRPEDLVRRAIVGAVTVTEIVSEKDSEWFGGPMGLRLADPVACDPIPAAGALGYFAWEAGGDAAPPLPWMRAWDRPNGDAATLPLFPDAAPSFRTRPERPRRR